MTPNNSLRSDLLYAMDGALESCPLIHCPSADPTRFESPTSPPSESGPSMSGASASPSGLRLPDLAISASGGAARLWPLFFRRRSPEMGDADLALAGLLPLDLDGERPRTTSSFRAEKKPCFFSIRIK